jgi:hypothetical protein
MVGSWTVEADGAGVAEGAGTAVCAATGEMANAIPTAAIKAPSMRIPALPRTLPDITRLPPTHLQFFLALALSI